MTRFARSFLGSLYRTLYRLRLWHEEHEVPIVLIELVLIFIALVAFSYEAIEDFRQYGRRTMEMDTIKAAGKYVTGHWHEFLHLLIFSILFLSMLARAAILLRRRHLGYSFARILGRTDQHGGIDFEGIFGRMRQMPWGSAACLECGEVEAVAHKIAESIAATSAALMSERSVLKEDDTWYRREKEYLREWINRFPWCVWRIREADVPEGDPCTGYVSVIVPITEFSTLSIENGHRATDTAEIDEQIAGCFLRSGEPDCVRPAPMPGHGPGQEVTFLAYVHVRVPSSAGAVDHERLLAASLQHLAVLLHRIFGAGKGFRRHWNFSILCETANWRQERVVTGLGFTALENALDKERAHKSPARSFAGFPLFKFTVRHGEPAERSGRTEGARFLRFLEDQVRSYAALATVAPNGKAGAASASVGPHASARLDSAQARPA